MLNIIKTIELKLEEVPYLNASIKKINEFALSFEWGVQNGQIIIENLNSDFEKLDLKKLRAILYFEQRRWNHYGNDYDQNTEERIRDLIRVIRYKLN